METNYQIFNADYRKTGVYSSLTGSVYSSQMGYDILLAYFLLYPMELKLNLPSPIKKYLHLSP